MSLLDRKRGKVVGLFHRDGSGRMSGLLVPVMVSTWCQYPEFSALWDFSLYNLLKHTFRRVTSSQQLQLIFMNVVYVTFTSVNTKERPYILLCNIHLLPILSIILQEIMYSKY